MKRISIQLFLALFTFFTGVFLTAFWIFVLYPSDLHLHDIVVSDSASEQNKILKLNNLESTENKIEIKYGWSLMGKDSLDGIFAVKNNSEETIYFVGYEKYDNRSCWIKQSGKVRATNIPNGDGIKEQELKPNESTAFSIPTPQSEKPFEAGFDFRIGSKKEQKTVWVKVEKQLKSYGISCKSKVVTPNSVLAETCIE